MSDFETIEYILDGRVARVTLSRPDVRNAFNEVLISELNELLVRVADEGAARALVLTGSGKAFCAGADLHWMGKMRDFTFEENLEDSLQLAKLMRRLYTLPVPTIAAVNGASIGGGNGLVAACDIVIAAESALFSLSEVKLGLVPSCIGPYVIKRVGEASARQLFLTGERISGTRAVEVGLANEAVPDEELMPRVDEILERLLTSGPDARRHAKELIENVPGMSLDQAERYTAEMISNLRVSPEAQEGMAAFFEKRKPRWVE